MQGKYRKDEYKEGSPPAGFSDSRCRDGASLACTRDVFCRSGRRRTSDNTSSVVWARRAYIATCPCTTGLTLSPCGMHMVIPRCEQGADTISGVRALPSGGGAPGRRLVNLAGYRAGRRYQSLSGEALPMTTILYRPYCIAPGSRFWRPSSTERSVPNLLSALASSRPWGAPAAH